MSNEDTVNNLASPPQTDSPTKENPMIIERLRGTPDGGVEFIMSLSKEQTYVLVNFAVMALIGQGLAIFQDEPAPQEANEDAKAAETASEESVTIGEQLH